MLYDQHGREIKKTITRYSDEPIGAPFSIRSSGGKAGARGATVYSLSQLQAVTGRDQEGRLVTWGAETPYFYLTIPQRIEIFKLSSPVFGIVTSRMKRLSGLDFSVTSESKKEEEIADQLKDMKDVYTEYKDSTEIEHLVLRARLVTMIKSQLPDIKPDLSNFGPALLRWKKRLQRRSLTECTEAQEWLMEPNNGVTWENFVEKFVFDALVHGSSAVYKKVEGGKLENFDILPGGSVYRLQAPYFSGMSGYVQVIPDYGEPQIMFSNEMAYYEYIPTSSRNYPMIPLEALINKIAETLLFDKLMAEQADGTKPPEKLVIVTENNPFGSLDSSEKVDIPLDISEQSRIEQKINEPIKNAIMTFSGNRAEVIDLSRENTMAIQMQRQKDIREEVALVFNTSNMEANLTGSTDTSGRSTAEVQVEIDQGKGVGPLAKGLMNMMTRAILPYRFGRGLIFEFELGKNDKEEKLIDQLMLQTGEMTKNEIREKYNKSSFGPDYDKPEGTPGMGAGANEFSPMFTRNV